MKNKLLSEELRRMQELSGIVLESKHYLKFDSFSDMKNRNNKIDFDEFSGGREGNSDSDAINRIYSLPKDIQNAFNKTINYLDTNNISWSVNGTWAPSWGWLTYLRFKKEDSSFNKVKEFFKNIKSHKLLPFVKENEDEINVWLFDPEDYKDMIGTSFLKESLEEASNDELLDLLNQIIDINLKNAPKLQILNITADDLEGANTNAPVNLKNSIASMETMEKYVVPYKGKIRIPVPTENNWDIYELTLEDLRTLVDELKALPDAEFKDLFRIAKNVGNFLFHYY
jgi:hypothetical protein